MTTRAEAAYPGFDDGVSDRGGSLPAWVPEAARNYLAHTEGGQTIRALAREAQVHPSTILRRVRRVESSRDDPLVDAALRQLSRGQAEVGSANADLDDESSDRCLSARDSGMAALAYNAMPVLRRLSEPGTILAVARDLEKGIVLRERADDDPDRLAVVDRRLAEAMALQDWIACDAPESRVSRYRITSQGRALLRAILAEVALRGGEDVVGPGLFGGIEALDDERLRHMRSLLAESPVAALARRRDTRGAPFLTRDLVVAGERLREDFEVAHRGSGPSPDWDALLSRVLRGEGAEDLAAGGGRSARARVARALADLGPGLADVVLRCCCLLEGMETFETRMGWSARSGKIVLRIALQRLKRHYQEVGGPSPLIG